MSRSRARLALAIVALAGLTPPAGAQGARPGAELIGTLRLSHDAPWFGGFSGIEMSPDGAAMLLINDRGRWARALIKRENGVPVAATGWNSARISGPDGRPQPRERTDSEGLARLPGGGLCMSYEGPDPGVDCHDDLRAPARTLPPHPDFADMGLNSSLEALAADGMGRLYTMPERVTPSGAPTPVYRWDGTAWEVVMQLPESGFRPVGADIVEEQFYILMRRFGPLGFSTRLIRLPVTGGKVEILLQTGPGIHDNLEGVSVWRNAAGALVATMVSDDNMNWFQRSEIVEYRLPEPPAQRDAKAGTKGTPVAVPLASAARSQ
ncbi:esterase-like activity of phytase family protein [Marinibacterium profundimaris]|uniref:esterase-like activity of phytase family protein n=1 Tax=Marinibacterium profundimaris TaxID=1679460 RepID=UPI000B527398|nr:esterase-like activity of phytase family protein [Marinibacterium profundimaris]